MFGKIMVAMVTRYIGALFIKLGFSGVLTFTIFFIMKVMITGEAQSFGSNVLSSKSGRSNPGEDSSRGWTDFDLDVIEEPFSETEIEVNSSIPRGDEAGPSNQPLPSKYPPDEVIGGDSILSIERRLLSNKSAPSTYEVDMARINAEDLFEVKVEILKVMSSLDPRGDWMGRGARALDNPRTPTGEESLERLFSFLEDLNQGGKGSETFSKLKDKVFLK
jgi:hypothetical protein